MDDGFYELRRDGVLRSSHSPGLAGPDCRRDRRILLSGAGRAEVAAAALLSRHYRTIAAVAAQPSRALGWRGCQRAAFLNWALLTRSDLVRDVSRSPNSSAARPGPETHARLPTAAAS